MLFFFTILFLTHSSQSLACEINWTKTNHRTFKHEKNVRPQGLTFRKNKILLSNHYKDSSEGAQTSEIVLLTGRNLNVEEVFKFPEPYRHISGLASYDKNVYAVDFDHQTVLQLGKTEDQKILAKELFSIPNKGLSGLAAYKDTLAVSNYIIPYYWPFLSSRKIRFFNINSSQEIDFKGDILPSNYSQGLTFFESNNHLYLAESINSFDSVIKYWFSGVDHKPDILRIYQIDLEKKLIVHVSDTETPMTMIEDLATRNIGTIVATDEQNYYIYQALITNCENKF